MEKLIDARGMQCPLPVIETKKILKSMENGDIKVIVDNEIAVQNLSKMAKQLNFNHSSETIGEDHYQVMIEVKKEGSDLADTKEEKEVKEILLSETDVVKDSKKKSKVVVISKDHMGEGDAELGKTLIKGFIYALTELETLPEKIIFYNGGAKLSVEGSDSLEDLKLLESQGVEILTCGACLNFYKIAEKLSVGSVTNMYVIAEILMKADSIIKP